MKKIIITTVLFLMMFSAPAFAGLYNRCTGTCIVEGCDRTTCDHSYYCSSHKCSVSHCRDRRSSSGSGLYCFGHKYKDKKAEKKTISKSNYRSRSKTSGSSKSSFDPDDHDIESYYDDYRDEYDDYDDAYDGFLDDDDVWDDYWCAQPRV